MIENDIAVDVDDVWKICATCRFLEVEEQEREIPELIDTEYAVFRCSKVRARQREYFLLEPVDKVIDTEEHRVCPYWEASDADGLNCPLLELE